MEGLWQCLDEMITEDVDHPIKEVLTPLGGAILSQKESPIVVSLNDSVELTNATSPSATIGSSSPIDHPLKEIPLTSPTQSSSISDDIEEICK